ncbi:MAG: response regulator [Candidatus Omnitrophica bacterium]|nr:response regulator [Candidatus Omnitrophota bacterium]
MGWQISSADIHKRTVLVIGVSLVALISAIIIASWLIVMRGFDELEHRFVRKNISRAEDVIADGIGNISIKLSDWAKWDDTCEFILHKNEAYMRSNLVDNVLSTINVDAMIFIDARGEIVYSMFSSSDNKITYECPPGIRRYLDKGSVLLDHSDLEKDISGIIMTPEGPLMVVSRAIVASDGNGPARGSLVFAAYLKAEVLKRYSGMIRADIDIRDIDSPRLPSDFQKARKAFSEGRYSFITSPWSGTISGFSVLKDIFGKPALILKVAMPNEITMFGMITLVWFVVALLVVGSIFGMVVYIPLNNEISSRQAVEKNLVVNQEALKIAKEKAELATRAKSYFLANISHEIRTPMNAIVGFLDLLRQTGLNDTQKDYVATAISSGEMLLELINHVLDISKIESEGFSLEKIDFDLGYLIESVIKILKPKMQGGDVEYLFEYSPSTSSFFRGDPTRIRQIILNLLSNAVKFTERGEVKVSVGTSGGPAGPGNLQTVTMSVRDTGIGIPADKQDLIFDLFTQADESMTRKYGGTGLGLAISRALARKMGGDITVRSEVARGSEFILTIALETARPAVDKNIALVGMNELKGRKVAIVDDNDIALRLLEYYSLECGMRVVFTGDRAEKLISWLNAENDAPDIVLSDIMMPGMDGYTLAKWLRQDARYARVKLIAVTADVRPGAAGESRGAGFDAYLPKPVIPRELINVIRTILGDNREEKEIVTRHTAEELSLKGVRVLVAEDKSVNRKLMKIYLDLYGCVSDFAVDGKEAVEKMRNGVYDICLMDVQMPVMSGIEAVGIIRKEIGRIIPIIAITAAAMKEDRERSIKSGMNDYLTKPVDHMKLKEMLIKWVNA